MACLSEARSDAAPYAELYCLSNYSFLRGASHPDELVERAAALGYRALALTDECSVAGIVRAHLKARERGLPLIVGTELRPVDGPTLVLLAPTRAAYAGLCRLITQARRDAAKGTYRVCLDDIAHASGELLALLPVRPDTDAAAAGWLAQAFPGRAWLGVTVLRDGCDAGRLARSEALARAHGLPRVACGAVLMHVRGRRALRDMLTAIRRRMPVNALGHARLVNGERHLRDTADLAGLYPRALLDETVGLAARCKFSLGEICYHYPDDVTPPGQAPLAYLRELTESGMRRRWPGGCPPTVRVQVEHELALIAELRYEAYFLTVWDLVRFARERGILCQGRGSAANSAVCYCLGITEVDPSRMNLLFERFISRERNEPPDIDVDFEHQRREEVIQYIYAKYGRERAALAATVITYRTRSAVRDVGRALGLGQAQIEALVAAVSAWRRYDAIAPDCLAEAGFDPDNPTVRQWRVLANQLRGFPRHLSQHVGGFVIAAGRLDELVPIENASMPERTVIQWEKDDLEALGLLKVDVLALGMLSAIRRALDLVNGEIRAEGREIRAEGRGPRAEGWEIRAEGRGPRAEEWEDRIEDRGSRIEGCNAGAEGEGSGNVPLGPGPSALGPGRPSALGPGAAALSLASIPAEDPAVYRMIQQADTLGVFQIESRAQMSMLPRLRPATFYDLVIEVAIVRPGPIQGDMVHPYLRRRQGKEPVDYPSDAVRDVLERTLGVPIFQEQVIKLATVAAGFSPGEADRLRRSMAAWKKRGGLEPYRERLMDGMLRRGYRREFAERLYRQILGFGDYGFPESHAASFALLVYASAWLKHYHPAAFCAALLNSQPMGFYAPAQLVRDAREHGVEVRPADVNHSDWDCTLERAPAGSAAGTPPAMRVGLRQVRGLSHGGALRIAVARSEAPFADVPDLARRARLDRGDLEALAAADTLSGLAGHRHQAAWQVAGIEPALSLPHLDGFREDQPGLVAPGTAQSVVADYAQLGLSLRGHPLALVRGVLGERGFLRSDAIAQRPPGVVVRAAGLVLIRQRPGNGRAVFATIEDECGSLNLLIWADLAERQRQVLLGAKLLGVVAEIQRAEGVQHLVCRHLEDHTDLLADLRVVSRDFQ